MTSFFSAEGGPIWIKFRRLVQNDMSTAVIWSKLSVISYNIYSARANFVIKRNRRRDRPDKVLVVHVAAEVVCLEI